MSKHTESKIAEAYWQTEAGQNLAYTMHSDGWEAVDCLNSVIAALDKSIEAAADETTTAELKKARKQILAAKDAYWKAAAILRDDEF